MSKYKFVLIAVAFLILASLACGGDASVYKYKIKIPWGDGKGNYDRYSCNDYTWLDNGDLELMDCYSCEGVTIVDPPEGVNIIER